MTDGKEVQAQGSGADGEGWNTGTLEAEPSRQCHLNYSTYSLIRSSCYLTLHNYTAAEEGMSSLISPSRETPHYGRVIGFSRKACCFASVGG